MRWQFLTLFFITLMLSIIDFSLGSVNVSLKEIYKYLKGNLEPYNSIYTILNDIRLPRVISAITSGFCLSITGLLVQTYFRNPLAGPYVLGISSGAGLGVAIFIMVSNITGFSLSDNVISIGISGFSFIGAIFFMFLIYLASIRLQNTITVLIAGILLGTAANALITFFQSISSSIQIQSFVYWNMGNISNTNINQSLLVLTIGLIIFIILLSQSYKLDLWLTGEEQAQSSGLSKKYITWIVFLFTSILVGATTAFYGPIAFVGLISPHIARMVFKTQLHSKLLIYTAFFGIFIMLVSDIIIQTLYFTNVPLNTITSILSLPLLTYIFLKKKELWM